MQSLYLLCRGSSSSSSGGGTGAGIFLLPSTRNLFPLAGMWAHFDRRARKPSDRTGKAASATGPNHDHYAVLGISPAATPADVKKAYRLLARKYHPDVNRDSQAGEAFKSIRLAYEVLSDGVARAQYDMILKFPESRGNSMRRRWAPNPEYSERTYRWANLRQQMQYDSQDEHEETSWYHEKDSYRAASEFERASFNEVLRFAFITLFFMHLVGHRASLALCGVAALFDQHLDFGYKMGYVIAWLFGGRGGVLLALCIQFASWLCGKKSSGRVALVVLAMWVGAHIARFAPLPQGALLALLFMSMKIQVDSK